MARLPKKSRTTVEQLRPDLNDGPVIGIIVNPHARKNRRNRRDTAAWMSATAGSLADVRTTASPDEVDGVAAEFRDRGLPMIGISGGDGTLHTVLSRLMRVYAPAPPPPLLILKGGTMDLVSRTLRLRGDGFGILRRLVARLRTGEGVRIHERDTLRAEGRFGFLFGAGAVTTFLEEVYAAKKGLRANLRVFGRAVFESIKQPVDARIFRPMEAQVTVDERPIPFNSFQVLIAGTVENYGHLAGVEFRPLSRALEKVGRFHTIVSGISPRELVRNLDNIRRGRAIRHELHFDGVVGQIRIAAAEPFSYTLDGDLYQSGGVLSVETGPSVKLVEV